MAKIYLPLGKCDRCGKELPHLDDKGKPNFQWRNTGAGWNSTVEMICNDCSAVPPKPKMTCVGFGV